MYKNLLAIGSVVLLKGGEKRLMITGRVVSKSGEDKIYDYMGCLFPQGIVNAEEMYFFDRDAIERVYFIGLQDEEELKYEEFLGGLGKLKVVNGQIVPEEE